MCPKPCLEDDDVDALSMMYPDCEIQSHSVNVCHKVNHNIGFVRVMIYFLMRVPREDSNACPRVHPLPVPLLLLATCIHPCPCRLLATYIHGPH